MKVVIMQDTPEGLWVSDEVVAGDETVDIPEVLWVEYRRRALELAKTENQIRQFAREQERQRAYSDE